MKIISQLVDDRDRVLDEIEEEFEDPAEAAEVWAELLSDADVETEEDDEDE